MGAALVMKPTPGPAHHWPVASLWMLTATEATPSPPGLSIAVPVMAPGQLAKLYAASAGTVMVEVGAVWSRMVNGRKAESLPSGFSTRTCTTPAMASRLPGTVTVMEVLDVLLGVS